MVLLAELLENVQLVNVQGDRGVEISGLHHDSREIRPGFLFVAIPGFKVDGHDFIPQAIAKGAVAVVGERKVSVAPGVTQIQVADSRWALGELAAAFYQHPSQNLRLVGVTGTNGKTTTTYLLHALFQAAGKKNGLLGTIVNQIGDQKIPAMHTTPEASDLQRLLAQMVQNHCSYGIMEVSSHALALKRVQGCAFDVAVFTNFTQDHLDFHPDMERYLNAKLDLFRELGQRGNKPGPQYAVINLDDPQSSAFIQAASVEVCTYGMEKPAMVRAQDLRITAQGSCFRLVLPGQEFTVTLKLTGRFNVYNALAALTVAWKEGLDLPKTLAALAQLSGAPGRFESVAAGDLGFHVVVDYAHTPDGLDNLLKTAREITRQRVLTVFGCGGDRDRKKRPQMGAVAARWSDYVLVTSDNPRTEDPQKIIADIVSGLPEQSALNYEIIPDRRQGIRRALELAEFGDVVVVAGKGHENYQILGERKVPFDDREVVQQLLAELRKE